MKCVLSILIIFLIGCSTPKESIVILNGSQSHDPDGYISIYYWTQVAGTKVLIVNPDSVISRAIIKNKGIYRFQLSGTDNGGLTGKAIRTIVVK